MWCPMVPPLCPFGSSAVAAISFIRSPTHLAYSSWLTTLTKSDGWQAAGFATADWTKPVTIAKLGDQPWGTTLPVIAIALLTIGTGLIGDGLSRAAGGVDRQRGDV